MQFRYTSAYLLSGIFVLIELCMTKNPEDLLREFAEQCRKKITEFDEAQVRCGLIGPSGSGKSSLMNAKLMCT